MTLDRRKDSATRTGRLALRKESQYPLNQMVGEAQEMLWTIWRRDNLLSPTSFEHQSSNCPVNFVILL